MPCDLTRWGVRRRAAWAHRLAPFNPKEVWRGPRPWAQGLSAPVAPLMAGGWLAVRGACVHFGRWRQAWLVWRAGGLAPTPLVATLVARFLHSLGGLCVVKMRYKGKSFKWHRRRASLVLRFGHSHLVALRAPVGVRWRRQGRMKLLLFGAHWGDLRRFAHTIIGWRPANVYHGRGLRLRRQWALRKAGKVSTFR